MFTAVGGRSGNLPYLGETLFMEHLGYRAFLPGFVKRRHPFRRKLAPSVEGGIGWKSLRSQRLGARGLRMSTLESKRLAFATSREPPNGYIPRNGSWAEKVSAPTYAGPGDDLGLGEPRASGRAQSFASASPATMERGPPTSLP